MVEESHTWFMYLYLFNNKQSYFYTACKNRFGQTQSLIEHRTKEIFFSVAILFCFQCVPYDKTEL